MTEPEIKKKLILRVEKRKILVYLNGNLFFSQTLLKSIYINITNFLYTFFYVCIKLYKFGLISDIYSKNIFFFLGKKKKK